MEHNCLFEDERFQFCELNSKFYKVNLQRKLVDEISFDELLVEYLVMSNSKIFKNFVKIYIRLCMKLFGVNRDYIKNKEDLELITEMWFKEGAIDE